MKPSRTKQLTFFKRGEHAFGGSLMTKRKGRCARPLSVSKSMHLVLRSSRAKGEWSFRKSQNARRIREIFQKFSRKFGVRILSAANVGNHLHLHVQLTNRQTYRGFIRAVTSAIAMAITGGSRWQVPQTGRLKFWDRRPFSRIVQGYRDRLRIEDYLRVNQLEGEGFSRSLARVLLPYQRFRSDLARRLANTQLG